MRNPSTWRRFRRELPAHWFIPVRSNCSEHPLNGNSSGIGNSNLQRPSIFLMAEKACYEMATLKRHKATKNKNIYFLVFFSDFLSLMATAVSFIFLSYLLFNYHRYMLCVYRFLLFLSRLKVTLSK
jgi:hypothetical protein